MITDKLLAFADGKSITATADSDTIDFGQVGDEIARTMNLVAQIDTFGASPTTTNTIQVELKGYDTTVSSGSAVGWKTLITFPAVTVAQVQAGARLVNFGKLPLGLDKISQLKLAVTVSSGSSAGALPSGTTYSAWLTPSAEKLAAEKVG